MAVSEDDLRAIPLFADLDPEALGFLVDHMQQVAVPIGGHIVKAGDYAYKFFVILAGTAAVSRDNQHVASLGAGDVFGEMALFDDIGRNADVVAISPMTLSALMSWDFRDALNQFPHFRRTIDDLVNRRS
jgi:CRP-like cAMP-binding protein